MIDEANIMVTDLVAQVLKQVARYALPEDEKLSVLAAVGSSLAKLAKRECVAQVKVGSRYATVELSTTDGGTNRALSPIPPTTGARLVCITCVGTRVFQCWELPEPVPTPISWPEAERRMLSGGECEHADFGSWYRSRISQGRRQFLRHDGQWVFDEWSDWHKLEWRLPT